MIAGNNMGDTSIDIISELHAGPNFATRPGKGVTRPDPTRPAKINKFLNPTRPAGLFIRCKNQQKSQDVLLYTWYGIIPAISTH